MDGDVTCDELGLARTDEVEAEAEGLVACNRADDRAEQAESTAIRTSAATGAAGPA